VILGYISIVLVIVGLVPLLISLAEIHPPGVPPPP
jgi:hypothetical protein